MKSAQCSRVEATHSVHLTVGIDQGGLAPLRSVCYTSSFSPTWLNEIGWSYSYGAIVSDPTGLVNAKFSPDINPLIKLPFAVSLSRVPSLSISGGTGITSFGEYRDFNRNYNFFDNMSKVRGAHAFRRPELSHGGDHLAVADRDRQAVALAKRSKHQYISDCTRHP